MNHSTHSHQAADIFDGRIVLPDAELTGRQSDLMGFEERYDRLRRRLRLLMHSGDLNEWSRRHHKVKARVCTFVSAGYPLALFYGDVGTGKTETAECIADRLVRDDLEAREKVAESELFKLSTRVRGSGRVGEMGTLLNEAFTKVKAAASKSRRAFLIIDEGDSLAASRSQEHSHHEDKVAVNTLIQNIDDLRAFRGRILVFLCTNRLGAVDPAIVRRAAVMERFERPDDAKRLELFRHDLSDLQFADEGLQLLVRATGAGEKGGVGWTYSDIRTRLYPYALAQVYPDAPLTLDHLLAVARELSPSPAIEDEEN